MALSASEAKFISTSSAIAKQLLTLYGEMVQIDQLWSGAADFDATITQGDIDAVPELADSGLTATVLGDAEFAMAGIKTAITNALPSLSVLANL